MAQLVVGMKVRYVPQPEWGVGHLVALHEADSKAEVQFPGRSGGAVLVSTRGGAVVPHQLSVGDAVQGSRGKKGRITGEEPGGRGLRRYCLRYDDGGEDELPESEVRSTPPTPDMLSMLREARTGDAKAFLQRRAALVLDDERRCDALGALFASRVMVKPHQVGVVQRVLSARRPRFVLADEVGLGKTIEAGMIFSALRLAGLARRVLVVAPSHLTVQWLAELFHKFNQLFTLMDADRYASSLKERPGVSPWARFDKVVTSLELLSRTEEHRAEAGEAGAFWDLVIFDEAHHLKGARAFEAAKALAQNSWGLLLLTATPMQLDPAEYHQLLTLIDPATAPTLDGFRARLSRQEELSEAVRSLHEGARADPVARKLSQKFPGDPRLKQLKDRDALLSHLAETYSLSDHLVRNRRAVVGGFADRKLLRHAVDPGAKELDARRAAVELLKEKGQLQGAALSGFLRRMESSPAAFLSAMRGSRQLLELSGELSLPARDAKYEAFAGVLRGIWAREKAAKVLVFTESRETLDLLQAELGRDGIVALGYHGDVPLLDRDRQVARFRDPEGPKVLVCTEVGGEGRNFQFSHHLVNYDLPWSPAVMEQRIGRLDRIGQMEPVQIHVFDAPGTLSSDVLAILADAVGVFGEAVGGLDAVLEEVEPRLAELALLSPEERVRYRDELAARVRDARAQVKRAYDPLLDLRSFDRAAVEDLVKRAHARMGMEEEGEADEEGGEGKEEAPSLEDGLHAISRDLDERLEEAITELAARIGIGVDTEEQVDAFQCAFHFGHALNVEALPGIDIQEEKTVLGSFWRDTAVEQEEIEYFATGHPIVEALFGFLRDGPYGRSAARFIEKRGGQKARGLELLFHVQAPEPEDTSAGARVPSRQLSRFLDQQLLRVAVVMGPMGVPRADAAVFPALEAEGRSLKGDEIRAAFPELPQFIDPAVAAGTAEAERQMRALQQKARRDIEEEREAALRRMRLALAHQGLPKEQLEAQLQAEGAHYAALLEALSGLRVELDSVCGFVLNR